MVHLRVGGNCFVIGGPFKNELKLIVVLRGLSLGRNSMKRTPIGSGGDVLSFLFWVRRHPAERRAAKRRIKGRAGGAIFRPDASAADWWGNASSDRIGVKRFSIDRLKRYPAVSGLIEFR
jgi:hypothetical protein